MIPLLTVFVLRAQAADLTGASAALSSGDLQGAEAQLRGLLDEGYVDADVYYDLGNVLWRRGSQASALLAWRRAEALAPRDADVGANLDFGRRFAVDAVPPSYILPTLAPWQGSLSVAEGAWAGGVLAGLGLLLLALRGRFQGSDGAPAPLLGSGLALLGVGAALGGGAVAAATQAPVAVVLAREVSAYSDPGGGVSLFTLHAGAEVSSLEATPSHVLLTLPDDRKGWVNAESVGLVDPFAPFPATVPAASSSSGSDTTSAGAPP